MGIRIKGYNLLFGLLAIAGAIGTAYEGYQWLQQRNINSQIQAGQLVNNEAHPFESKFMAAYKLGEAGDHKHALQSYTQLLETLPTPEQQARVQYNIGNNLMQSAMKRRLNDDGSLKDEAKYDLSQARIAYEQALRLKPEARQAKFNLSLMLALMPQGLEGGKKEQEGMELSNIPVGLP